MTENANKIGSKQRLSRLALASALPIVLLVIWEGAVRADWWPRSLIAAPSEVAEDLFRLLTNGTLFIHSFVSLKRLLIGFLVGSTIGVILGSLVGLSKTTERIIGPTLQLLAPIPPVAWIPILIILFGIDEASKIALIALGTFFVVYVSTVQGIRRTDQKLVEVAYVYNKTSTKLVSEVLLPSALPSILTGLRVALGLSWILLIAAEVIASSKGLGWLIWDSRNFSRPADMIVGMIMVGLLGKCSDQMLVGLQSFLLRWQPSFQGK